MNDHPVLRFRCKVIQYKYCADVKINIEFPVGKVYDKRRVNKLSITIATICAAFELCSNIIASRSVKMEWGW